MATGVREARSGSLVVVATIALALLMALVTALLLGCEGAVAATPSAGAPVVMSDPQAVTGVVGSPVTATSTASGSPQPTVQWEYSFGGARWSAIAGATSTTLHGVLTARMDGVLIRATFTNSHGTVSSLPASVHVLATPVAPVVVSQPLDVTAGVGQSVEFNADASGVPTPTIQWEYSSDAGQSWRDVLGAGGRSRTLTVVTTVHMNGWLVRAVFSNAGGAVTTSEAELTVVITPRVQTRLAGMAR